MKSDIRYSGKSVAEWREEFQVFEFSSTGIPDLDFPFRKDPDPKSLPLLLVLIQDEQTVVRSAALRCLGYLEKDAEVAIPQIERALSDANVCVQISAATALGEIGPVAKRRHPV